MELNKYIQETFIFLLLLFSVIVVICRHNFYLLFSLTVSVPRLWGNKKSVKHFLCFLGARVWEKKGNAVLLLLA